MTLSLHLPVMEKVPVRPEMYDVSYNKMKMTTVILSSFLLFISMFCLF